MLDWSGCTFFEANMAAPLAAVLGRVADSLTTVSMQGVLPSVQAILCKNGFLPDFGFPRQTDTNHTTLPFTRMALNDQRRFADYLAVHLEAKGMPAMSEALAQRFRQSIHEVFNNAVVHSESDLGVWVCGQFYPNKKRIDLTISDSGIGIRQTVRRRLGQTVSSTDAIQWALTAGNTSRKGETPGGVGLKLLREFIGLNKGKLQIASRHGFYEASTAGERYAKLDADLPGTTVNLEVNTDDPCSYCLESEVSPDNVF